MSYIKKTDWRENDIVKPADMNRIEQGIEDAYLVKKAFHIRVAASDATDREKAAAHYICDGINDEEEIAAAIEGLPAGGVICLSSGIFKLRAGIEISKDITIKGQGLMTEIGHEVYGEEDFIYDMITVAGNSKCCFSDFRMDGVNGSFTDSGIMVKENATGVFDNLKIQGMGLSAVRGYVISSKLIITRCTFPAGIGFSGGTHTIVNSDISGIDDSPGSFTVVASDVGGISCYSTPELFLIGCKISSIYYNSDIGMYPPVEEIRKLNKVTGSITEW